MSDSLYRLPDIPTTVRHLTTEQGQWVSKVFPRKRGATSFCPTCGDDKEITWYIPDESGNTRNLDSTARYACPCEDQFLLNRRFLHAGILERYQTLEWDDFFDPDPDALDPVIDYISDPEIYIRSGIGLTLWGRGRGTGKTLTAALTAKSLVGQGYDVFMRTFEQILDDMASGWKDKEDKVWFNSRIRNASVLVMDDLGRERNRGVDSLGFSALEGVMRHRAARSLSTIITTNDDPKVLMDTYGPHTTSLLAEQQIPVHFRASVDQRDQALALRVAEARRGITRPVMV